MTFAEIIEYLKTFWHLILPTFIAIYWAILYFFIPKIAWRFFLPYWVKIQAKIKEWKEAQEAKHNLLNNLAKAMCDHETRAKADSEIMKSFIETTSDNIKDIKDDIYEIRTQQASQGGKIEILAKLLPN